MDYYSIPTKWVIGIDTIDQEHQALLNLLSINSGDGAPPLKICDVKFEDFLGRLTVLMDEKLNHMVLHKYHDMERVRLDDHKSIKQLEDIHKNSPSMLIMACRSVLLRVIEHSKKYYEMYEAKEGT